MKRTSKQLPPEMAAHLERIVGDICEIMLDRLKSGLRFYGMETSRAATELLKERGTPMHLNAIVQELIAGGVFIEATGAKGSNASACENKKPPLGFHSDFLAARQRAFKRDCGHSG
jgi:hypothetical protein